MSKCNINATMILKEIAVKRLNKITNATEHATIVQRESEKDATNALFNEAKHLVDWFFENIDFFPKEKFDVWKTKHGSETWNEPQKVYDFIIKATKEKGSDFEHAITEIRKLKQKMEIDKETFYEKEKKED